LGPVPLSERALCALFCKANCAWCVLQNPVITVAWSLCLTQVVVPAVMFPWECYPYCKKVNTSGVILVAAFLIYTTLCCTLGPGFYDANDIFKFYSLPLSFNYKLEILCLACSVGYVFVLVKARRLIAWYGERRIFSAP